MKDHFRYGFLLLLVLLYQCKDEAVSNCPDIKEGLLYFDVALAKPGIDEFLEDLQPHPSGGDLTGHEENLDVFMQRLTDNCDVQTSLACYGCIETFPLQSEVILTLDSAGHTVRRTLDLWTPEDNVMTLRTIHE